MVLVLELRRGAAAGVVSWVVGYDSEVVGARDRKVLGKGSILRKLLVEDGEEDILMDFMQLDLYGYK